jgi:uncharacterized SAM-binding protein YcdF (DUF218 family)
MDNLSITILELGKAILKPSILLIVALMIGTALLWSPRPKIGRWVTTIIALLLSAIAILPIAAWVAKPLERRFPPIRQMAHPVTGIIVLGGAFETGLTAEWGQPQLNGYAERLFAFMTLARQFPSAKLVFSGGAESEEARHLFASMGMDTKRIMFEARSRNTCENAEYSGQLVKPLKEQTWVLVTSAMDMPRAVGAFREAGFRVLPYPVDYTTGKSMTFDPVPTIVRNLDQLDHAAHEWLGLIAYRFLNCTSTLFPGPSGG